MTKILKDLADGTQAEFDTDIYSPEVIDRYVADFNSKYKPPSPVPTGDTNAPSVTGLPNVDPSQYDEGLTWLGKQAGALLQGTGRGFAGLGDFAVSGINAANEAVTNPIRKLAGIPEHATGFVHPLTEAYDKYAPAAPLGYEDTAGWGEMLGPIGATEILSGGAATPEALAAMRGSSFLPKLAKVAETTLVKPLIKTPVVAGTGIVGGQVGGGLAEMAGYDKDAQTLATALGSAIAPSAAMPATKGLANKLTMDTTSAAKLARLKRQGIDPTMADVGTPGVQVLQDVTGRGVFGGGPAFKARAELSRRLEQAVIDNTATSRGRSSGTVGPDGLVHADTITPQPATGPITKDSIGGEIGYLGQEGTKKAEQLISDIQEKLAKDVGIDTPTDPQAFYDRMDQVFAKVKDEGLRDQLRQIVDEFNRNATPASPGTKPVLHAGTGAVVTPGVPPTPAKPPVYGAVSGNRSETGRMLDKQGRSLKKGFTKQAYRGQTEVMKDTAEKQGVTDFDQRQAATEQLYTDIEGMKKAKEASGSGAAYDSLFAGANKQSVEKFDPFLTHMPEDTARVLANQLDLSIRGPGRAGMNTPDPHGQGFAADVPDPTRFNLKRLDDAITSANPEHLTALTGGIPEVEANLRDAAEIAHTDVVRKGQRTKPGGPGSTIGALALPGVGTVGGLIHGLMANPGALGGDLSSILMTALSTGAGFAGGEASTYGLGKLLTNPAFTEAIANPVNSVGTGLRRALQGANAEAAYKNRKGKTDEDRSIEEELGRRYVK